MTKLYCVIYRTGGTDNFRWKRNVANTKEATLVSLAGIRQMGYTAFMEDYEHSMSIGLPETFAASDPIPGNEI